MTTPATLTVLQPDELRRLGLRYVRLELIRRGVANPNVSFGSDLYCRYDATANQIAPAMANAVLAADRYMPDTATGDDLIRWLTLMGLTFRPAQPSNGAIVYETSATGFVQVGSQLFDTVGNFFFVTVGGTYANGALIPVQAVSGGATTNHPAGTVLQWVIPPPYSSARALVATGGLIDGADADTEAIAQARLLARLKTAVGGGNWAQTVLWAEEASSGVVAAYDYPALNGPATYSLWLLGQLTYDATNGFSRQISDALRTLVGAAVEAQKPKEGALVMPSLGSPPYACDVATNVSIGLSLSDVGGWLDASPWPSLSGTAKAVVVHSVTSPYQLVLDSADASCPNVTEIVDGVTQVSWFDPASYAAGAQAIFTSTVVSHSGSAGSVTVNLDPRHPFTNVRAGDYVFPAATNAEAYAQAWLAKMAELGPGEWTADVTRLANNRGKRHPFVSTAAPSSLTGVQTKPIQDMAEVLDVQYLAPTTAVPAVPADTTTVAPNVLVPGRCLGFYPL